MSLPSRRLQFPDNLSPGQRQYIEAVRKHKTLAAAAISLGLCEGTLANGLKKARLRAGVNSTKALLARYFAPKGIAA